MSAAATDRPDVGPAGRGSHQLLLVSAPDVPAAIAKELASELPDRLDGGDWRVTLDDEELVAENLGELVDAARDGRSRTGAELAVCLTDVPLRTGKQPLVAALDADEGIAVVSVPAGGATLLRRRVKRTTEAVIAELVEQETSGAGGAIRAERVELPDDLRLRRGYALRAGLGHARLLAGMVRANRPWRAFSSLSSAVVAALGTGAYAVITSSVWQLSGRLSPARLLAVMLISLFAVIGWLIVAHRLWERDGNGKPAKERRLYNAATALTVGIAVVWGYVVLFVVLLGAAGLFVESSVFGSVTRQPVDFGTYVSLAWLAASIATIAGGLGSGLEDIDEVRDAAYGHDQRRRGED
jgi:uncharacterized membrane protein